MVSIGAREPGTATPDARGGGLCNANTDAKGAIFRDSRPRGKHPRYTAREATLGRHLIMP